MSNKIKRKSLEEINILRGILCLFVLIIHTTATPSMELMYLSPSSIVFSILNIATKVAVPGFIFISGITLAYSYREKGIEDIFIFYKKRIMSVLVPYFIWTLIYYGSYIILYNYEISLSFLVNKLINGSMVYHLYFVIIIVQMYILFPMLIKVIKRYNNIAVPLITVLINFIIFSFISSHIFFGKYIAYFVIGMYIGLNYDKSKNIINNNAISVVIIGILATIYYIVEEYIYRHLGIVINKNSNTAYVFSLLSIPLYYVISIYIVQSNKINILKIKNLLNKIAKVSFSIYLIHPLVIILLERLLRSLSISLKYTVMTLLLVLIAILYAIIMDKRSNTKKAM